MGSLVRAASRSGSGLSMLMMAAVLCVLIAGSAAAIVTECVSVNSSGVPANGASANGPTSSDGRYVAFYSVADNLVEGDTNGTQDVFLFDRQTGVTTRVSVSSGDPGGEANGPSCEGSIKDTEVGEGPVMSANGRFVAFSSSASNLVPNDTNGVRDIFVRNTATHTTTRVSISSSGEPANGACYYPSISADGMRVVFVSDATNLVPGDTNNAPDVFLHDRSTGQTYRVNLSSAPANAQATGQRGGPSEVGLDDDMTACISGDGLHVAFVSSATNLMTSDTNDTYDVFVRDLDSANPASGVTECVHVSSSGVQGNGFPWAKSKFISHDGSVVTFCSRASNLVAGDTNGKNDIFVRIRPTSTTERISNPPSGGQTDGDSTDPSCSADARVIAYTSTATNLATPPGDGSYDCYVGVHNVGTKRLAVSSDWSPLPGIDALPILSSTGRYATLLNAPSMSELDKARVMLTDAPAMSVSVAKRSANDTSVIISGGVVSAIFPGAFYFQQDGIASAARIAGVRVDWNGSVNTGKRYIVTGAMKTDADGERYVLATSVDPLTSGWTVDVKPLGMPNKLIGGGNWRYDQATGAGQQGVTNGAGLNNIGLLVRTTGSCVRIDDHTFTIDDGSGVVVTCETPSTILVNPSWRHVAVTGACSVKKLVDKYVPRLKVTSVDPIVSEPSEGITGRWEATSTSGWASGVMGMLLVHQGSTVTGTTLGGALENGLMEAGVFTGTVTSDYGPYSVSLALQGDTLTGTMTDQEGGSYPLTYHKVSANPVSPYIGRPRVLSASCDGDSIDVVWDRPVMGYDRDIIDSSGNSIITEWDSSTNSYDPATHTFHMPLPSSTAFTAGATYTVLLESGDYVDWHDPYGAPAWDTDAECYRFDYTAPAGPLVGDKTGPDGSAIELRGMVVTASPSGSLYVERPDRIWGIRVDGFGSTFALGRRVDVSGILRTDSNGERYIQFDSISALPAATEPLQPLGMPNKALGGGDAAYDSATGAGQRGATGGAGLNNVGLLVRTWGTVTAIDPSATPTWFTIDDGSGVGVKCEVPSGVAVQAVSSQVGVTGISRLYESGGQYHRRLLVRGADDIRFLGDVVPEAPPFVLGCSTDDMPPQWIDIIAVPSAGATSLKLYESSNQVDWVPVAGAFAATTGGAGRATIERWSNTYLRVTAINSAGESLPSQIIHARPFEVEGSAIIVDSPTEWQTGVSTTPTISWRPAWTQSVALKSYICEVHVPNATDHYRWGALTTSPTPPTWLAFGQTANVMTVFPAAGPLDPYTEHFVYVSAVDSENWLFAHTHDWHFTTGEEGPVIPEGVTGRWEATLPPGSTQGIFGLLLTQTGNTVQGTARGLTITNGVMTGNILTGTINPGGDTGDITMTFTWDGETLSGEIADVAGYFVMPLTFHRLSYQPISPYVGRPRVISATCDGTAIDITWDRPVNGVLDYYITDEEGHWVDTDGEDSEAYYNPDTYAFHIILGPSTEFMQGVVYTVHMDSRTGDPSWLDPYGAPAWDDPSDCYSFQFSGNDPTWPAKHTIAFYNTDSGMGYGEMGIKKHDLEVKYTGFYAAPPDFASVGSWTMIPSITDVGYSFTESFISQGFDITTQVVVTSTSATVNTPAGTFNQCLVLTETITYADLQQYLLEYGSVIVSRIRYFAPGVGPVGYDTTYATYGGGSYTNTALMQSYSLAGSPSPTDWWPMEPDTTWTFRESHLDIDTYWVVTN